GIPHSPVPVGALRGLMTRLSRHGWIVSVWTCAAFVMILAPAVASAADTFADASRPDDSGDCLTPATACKTIGAATTTAGPGDMIHVEPGSYAENVVLSGGKSLVGESGNPKPAISPMTGVALTVGGGAGTIRGLTFSTDVPNQPEVRLADDAGSPTFTHD